MMTSQQANMDNSDNPDEEPSNQSETSSTSTCTSETTTTLTTTTSSNSLSSSTSTGLTDTENIDRDIVHSQPSQDSCSFLLNNPSSCVDSSPISCAANQNELNYLQAASAGQFCDTRTAMAKCPFSSNTASPASISKKEKGDEVACCNFYTEGQRSEQQKNHLNKVKHINNQSRSSSAIGTHDTQSWLSSDLFQADSTSTLNVDEQSTKHDLQHPGTSTKSTSLAPTYSNSCSTTPTWELSSFSLIDQLGRTLKPAPHSPSIPVIDTNNNKNSRNPVSSNEDATWSREGTFSMRRTNFSKSASGSRLISKSRQSVCDCLSQDCGEKKHSNRRQFIEHYYNSRTQLPRANTSTSSFNVSTPLNRLSECDAITRRLLSSPIRSTNAIESPLRHTQTLEVDKSRRASLGTSSITERVFVFSSNPFRSLELNYRKNLSGNDKSDPEKGHSSENDVKLKQQGRSLSICDEETLHPRVRGSSSNYSPSLNRAISLACDSEPLNGTRRLLNIIPLFGCDIKSLDQLYNLGLILPPVIESAVDHLLVKGINSIGIFRKSGVKSRIITLKQRIENNQDIKFDEINQNNEFSIYDIADLVKMWFRELKPLPLMTRELIKIISTFLNSSTHLPKANVMMRGNSSQQDTRTSSIKNEVSASNYIDPVLRSKIDSITSPTHRALLSRALDLLAKISLQCETNQMTSQNLAICLAPSLCATESDQGSILIAQKALEYCIDNHRVLFCRRGE